MQCLLMYKMETRYAATVPQQFVGVNDIVEEEKKYMRIFEEEYNSLSCHTGTFIFLIFPAYPPEVVVEIKEGLIYFIHT